MTAPRMCSPTSCAKRELVTSLADSGAGEEPVDDPVLPESYEAIRWFSLPGEAQREGLQG